MQSATAPGKPARPPIHLIDTEAERLASMAVRMAGSLPELSELLLEEIDRAEVHPADAIPADVVTMYSIVEFSDEATGKTRTVQLVYPPDADISAGKVSIMTPVGAGLIGLSKGQSIAWPDRDGTERLLKIIDVRREPTN